VASFVDTNVLVYAEDRDAGRKHEIARDLILQLWTDRAGVVSVQVLQELYVTLTRKVRKTLSAGKALEIVREYLTWRVVENTGSLLVEAVGVQQKAGLSFWDASIIAAGLAAGCDRLYSEDLNAGQRFGALEIVNPFARGAER
jgi:predicted nucleic acid-binding protein